MAEKQKIPHKWQALSSPPYCSAASRSLCPDRPLASSVSFSPHPSPSLPTVAVQNTFVLHNKRENCSGFSLNWFLLDKFCWIFCRCFFSFFFFCDARRHALHAAPYSPPCWHHSLTASHTFLLVRRIFYLFTLLYIYFSRICRERPLLANVPLVKTAQKESTVHARFKNRDLRMGKEEPEAWSKTPNSNPAVSAMCRRNSKTTKRAPWCGDEGACVCVRWFGCGADAAHNARTRSPALQLSDIL